jgi:Fic family protein
MYGAHYSTFMLKSSYMEHIQSSSGRTFQQPGGYLAFLPNPLPREELTLDVEVVTAVTAAGAAVGELKGVTHAIPNRDLFLAMYVRKEAILSSQIENIECTLDEVLVFEESGEGTKDVASVVHYVEAMNLALERQRRGDRITLPLIQEIHGVLMRDGKAEHMPGHFRETQNWIGRKGADDVQTARYVPPPVDHMHLSLGNLDYYINEYHVHTPVVRAALAHAQFETIHPFHDGNGRLGRMLIPLMLARDGVLDSPLLYPSLFLRNNRTEYYDRLMATRTRADWNGWIRFFAEAIIAAAREAITKTRRISELHNEISARSGQRRTAAMRLAEQIFATPVLTIKGAMKLIGTTYEPAKDAMSSLVERGIMTEITGRKRNRTFRFNRYLEILAASGEN